MSSEPPETFSFGQTHEAMVAVGGEYFLVWSLRRRRQNEQCRVSALTAGSLALKPIKARRPIPGR